MNNKEFFERAVPATVRTYPCPDSDTFINAVLEKANDTTVRRKIPKRFIIIPLVAAAMLALTGAVVHEVYRYGFEEDDIISELKVGKYYLETYDGYDPDCYIEVYDNYTLQIFGIEQKDDWHDWNSAPVKYGLYKNIPGIAVNDARDILSDYLYDDNIFFVPDEIEERTYDHVEGGIFIGLSYADENTIEVGYDPREYPNAKDYTEDWRREEQELLHPDDISGTAHFVYEGVIASEQ